MILYRFIHVHAPLRVTDPENMSVAQLLNIQSKIQNVHVNYVIISYFLIHKLLFLSNQTGFQLGSMIVQKKNYEYNKNDLNYTYHQK